MKNIERKELKKDAFVREVGHTVEYVEQHRKQVYLYGGAALAILLVVAGIWQYRKSAQATRHKELNAALAEYDATVGPGASPFFKAFKTQEEKDKAVNKAFNDLVARHGDTEVGTIARYYLGLVAADKGRLSDAEKFLRQAVDQGTGPYVSLARFSLAQVLAAQGKDQDAEKVLRQLIASPNLLVTKEQATILLGKILARTKPDEGRKLLEPLRTERAAVSRAAISALSEMGRPPAVPAEMPPLPPAPAPPKK